METRTHRRHRSIAIAGIIWGILGLLKTIIIPFLSLEQAGFLIGFIPGGISFFSFDLIQIKTGKYGIFSGISILSLLYFIMLLKGSRVLLARGKDESGLVRFIFSLLFYSSLIGLVNIVVFRYGISFNQIPSLQNPDTINVFWQGAGALLQVVYVALSIVIIKRLDLDFRVDVIEVNDWRGVRNESPPVNRWVRFLHLFIDYLLLLMMGNSLWYYLTVYRVDVTIFGDDKYGWWIAIIVARLFFYLIFETIFKTTPAKLLTGSRIVQSASGDSISNIQAIGRSLSRFIPFEPLSFFGKVGWHDSITGTTVTKEQGGTFKRSFHWWWLVFAVVGTSIAVVLRTMS